MEDFLESRHDLVDVCGVGALFVQGYVPRRLVKRLGLHCYDVRGGLDDDPGLPATIEQHPVTVNRVGSILVYKELNFPEEGVLSAYECMNNTGDAEMSVGQYLEVCASASNEGDTFASLDCCY